MAEQALEGPGQRVGRGLVAGEHERQQLVAELLVGEALALLGLRIEQQGEDVGAAFGPAPGLDHRVHVAVEVGERGLGHAHGLVLARVHELEELSLGTGGQVHEHANRPPERVLGSARHGLALDAEDAGHDHVEGDGLHARRERERRADRPAVDLAVRGLADHAGVALHRLAVERREQQLALAHVARADGREHRVRPHDRAQGRFARDRRRLLGPGREERLDVIGMRRDRGHVAAAHERVDAGRRRPARGARATRTRSGECRSAASGAAWGAPRAEAAGAPRRRRPEAPPGRARRPAVPPGARRSCSSA